jgi:hypothetical protein
MRLLKEDDKVLVEGINLDVELTRRGDAPDGQRDVIEGDDGRALHAVHHDGDARARAQRDNGPVERLTRRFTPTSSHDLPVMVGEDSAPDGDRIRPLSPRGIGGIRRARRLQHEAQRTR